MRTAVLRVHVCSVERETTSASASPSLNRLKSKFHAVALFKSWKNRSSARERTMMASDSFGSEKLTIHMQHVNKVRHC